MTSSKRSLDSGAAYRISVIVGLVTLVIDQLTKNWARDNLAGEPPFEVIGTWLQFTYAKNPGAAFSLFTGSGRTIGVIAIGVVVFLLIVIGKSTRRSEAIGLGLILGGALGNLTDRIARADGFLDGSVVDWIDWWFIPTFNIADAALNVGVAILLLSTLSTAVARD
ncbi:MAG: signal peptidase II [Acidimicrobiia bacterium]|nr:signal peptidase II [Acidimicrobiia bacterium]